MDALRKQASKLRSQVAKQQQAVIKQFGGTGYESSDVMVIDEVEKQRHQQLEKLSKLEGRPPIVQALTQNCCGGKKKRRDSRLWTSGAGFGFVSGELDSKILIEFRP